MCERKWEKQTKKMRNEKKKKTSTQKQFSNYDGEKLIFNMHGSHALKICTLRTIYRITIIRCIIINWINDQVKETERFHEFK